MSAAVDRQDKAQGAPGAGGDGGTGTIAPTAPIRWQAAFYRSYLAEALKRLADDPNPDVQRIGVEMNRCLNCPSTERCASCPFNRGTGNTVRGVATAEAAL